MGASFFLLLACSGGTQDPSGLPNRPAIHVQHTKAMPLPLDNVPELSPSDRMLLEVARSLGVRLGRCPMQTSGRVQHVYGLVRDHVLRVGPAMMVDVRDSIPWSPILDESFSENEWVSVLLEPGSNNAWVRAAGQVVSLSFPASVENDVVVCSDQAQVQSHIVVGSVEPRDAQIFVMGCGEHGVQIAKDGTFVVEVTGPCPLWLESSDGFHTLAQRIDPSVSRQDLGRLTLVDDPLVGLDLGWTLAGKEALRQIVMDSGRFVSTHERMFEEVRRRLEGDEKALARLSFYERRLGEWREQVGEIQKSCCAN